MNRKVVGILICMLLIVNASTVLSISREKVNINQKRGYYIFENLSDKRDIRYFEIDDNIKNNISKKIINNPDDNLASNPSFEEGYTYPKEWTYKTGTNGIFNWDSNYAHTGDKSVGVLNLTTNSDWDLCWISDFIPVNFIEYAYLLTVWSKIIEQSSNSNQDAFVGYIKYDVDYNYLGGYGQGTWSNSSEWWNFGLMVPRDIEDSKNWSKVKYIKIYLGQIYWSFLDEDPDSSVEVRFDDVYLGVYTKRPTSPTCRLDKINKDLVVSSTDADGDRIRYGVIWNGTNSLAKWTEYYNSGEKARIDCKGRSGTVEIFAQDTNGAFSMVSFSIKSKEKSIKYPIINWLLDRFSNCFPFLVKILNQILI